MERNQEVKQCRDRDAARYPARLPAKDAKLHPPVICRRRGDCAACWREREEIRRREITAAELPEFGRSPGAPSAYQSLS